MWKNFNFKIISTNFKAKSNKKKTWISINPCKGEFQLAIYKNYYKEIQNVKERKLFNIKSYHYLSQIKINFILALKQKPKVWIPEFIQKILEMNKKEFQNKILTNNPKNGKKFKIV